jgi:LacI family transcriptional regulator, repressor for deo operon, udp, cdd, tsx, nupC, and nupG
MMVVSTVATSGAHIHHRIAAMHHTHSPRESEILRFFPYVKLFIFDVKLYILPFMRNHPPDAAWTRKDANPMGRPTIDDVARIAGVSIATVSRCLHMPDVVAAKTRDRVLAAVHKTGYTLNAAAQSLRQRRSNTVLVVVPGIGNTFFAEILGGIEQQAAAAGLTMLIGDTGRSKAREDAYVRYLLNGRADGVLLLAEPQAAWFDIPNVNAHGIRPVVTISEVGPDHPTLAVSIDNEAAAHTAVNHLIAQGHRRIAHLTGPHTNILTRQRLLGYRRALHEAGLACHAEYEFPGDFGVASGRAAFDLFRAQTIRPTAIFCANDETAMGFIASAHHAGVMVPRDISVVGFDDIHFAQSYIPALTTVRQPRAEMGAAGMRLLLAILANEAPVSVRLTSELILRDSTAVCRQTD